MNYGPDALIVHKFKIRTTVNKLISTVLFRVIKSKNPRFPEGFYMVGTTGIEPVTPSMSTRCSPAELRAL